MQLWVVVLGLLAVAVAYPGAEKPKEALSEITVREVVSSSTEAQEIHPVAEGEAVTEAAVPVDKVEKGEDDKDKEVEPTGAPVIQGKVSYQGAQLWKVVVDTATKRKTLARLKQNLDISTWGGNTTTIDVLVKPGALESIKKELKKAGMNYEVAIVDLQRAIDEENPPIIEEELDNRKGHKMSWQMYHRFSDIEGYLDFLAQTYPSICSVQTIGRSVEGKSIKVLKLSNGRAGNKAIWVDGGIHAREWITPATVTYIINQLVENFESETDTVKNLDWYFAPVLNPDGYEYSHSVDRLWRKNRRSGAGCAGTDLNRNFGYRWGGRGSSKNPCMETYGGASAFSEPETAAIQRFITGTPASWKGYISFHSYGQYILFPWGYDKVVPPDYKDLQAVGNKAAADQLSETKDLVEQLKIRMTTEENVVLANTKEELKDAKELNTALQLQLDKMNKTQQMLKINYEELTTANRNLERRLVESDSIILKYKNELIHLQEKRERVSDSEANVSRLLELERMQVKNLKSQTEKDARCIQDLNRQVKEMERIIARKHPDSVSALIVAAKNEIVPTNESNRVLEERIKQLENEALSRDTQSSKVFLEIQDKFNQMKAKYESHIEDLELHVNDLKDQLKRKSDTFDVYTQTFFAELQNIPSKDISSTGVQTDPIKVPKTMVVTGKRQEKPAEVKEETHLLATIRGLQSDLASKEKAMMKLVKEIDELKKTNRRLQKEREGSLKNLYEKERFSMQDHRVNGNQRTSPDPKPSHETINNNNKSSSESDNDLKLVIGERDKLKLQLIHMEEDYTTLKTKRLQDLNALQEAHEREIGTYITNISPLREQLEVQQVSITNLQSQLSSTKEQLAIVTVERDHLDNRLNNIIHPSMDLIPQQLGPDGDTVQKKMACLEQRYAEREGRLRAIVHGLAQKQITSRDCDQCAARQQQLIGYKAELDQLLATLRYLQ